MKKSPNAKIASNGILSSIGIKKGVALALAIVVIGGVSYLGAHNNTNSHAATATATLALMPATNKYQVGDTIPVVVQVNSVTGISTIEAGISYPSSLLKFLSVTEGSIFTVQGRTATGTAGTIDIIRTLPGGTAGATGANTVVTVNFQVLAAGTATVGLTTASGVYDIAAGANIYDATSSKGGAYTLQLPPPTISSASPASGLSVGTKDVTITGTNFVAGATVKFGTAASPDATVVNSTTLTASAQPHSAGTVSVIVTNPDGQSATLSNGFVYNNPGPSISSISPTSGLSTGGTAVTITGAGFSTSPVVKIGGITATNVVLVGSTTITATTPAHAAGLTDVVVTNSDAQSVTQVGGFTYKNAAPTITSVSPIGGTISGGAVVTISGTNFIAGATVTFGGTAATSVSVSNGNTITATAPMHVSGAADIKVTNPDGQTVTKTAGFSYTTAGDINNDGHVNTLDLTVILTHDGQNYAAADLNHDNTVGAADLAILLAHWTW
jgi:hypothetical protein